MNEETAAPDSAQTPVSTPELETKVDTPADINPPSSPPAPPARPPKWLPLFLLAVVPAVVVALAMYFVAGGDGGGSGSGASGAGVLDGFFRLGPASDGDVKSFKEELPPGFPKDVPIMGGSKIVGSFEIVGDEGTNYFAVFSGTQKPDELYNYYLGVLDKDPWQIEVARASTEFTGLRFSRPDNPDITGDITVHYSALDKKTVSYVSIEDASKKLASGQRPADAFTVPASRELPPGFPDDIPVYKGKDASIVTDTYFERGQGGKNFIVSAITKDSQDQILQFYRDEFTKRGWVVKDGASSSSSRFQLSIDFNDGSKGEISGTIRTDAFDDDPSYTQVDLLLQVSSRRARGN